MTKKTQLAIDGRKIGLEHPPYICAEISANHNGKIEYAMELIRQAKLAGADAVKIQTYRPDTITLNSSAPEFLIKKGLWAGRTLYELYEEAHLPWEWHAELFHYAKQQNITIFSSPFDETAIDFLESLNAPAYKIASFEISDLNLIKYAANTKKPIILSTGIANQEDILLALETIRSTGNDQIIVLHCVSGYPAPPREYNLKTITDMRKRFGVEVGLSDHTMSNTTSIGSVMLGGTLIEKHFTLDRANGGPDDSFSMEPKQLAELCSNCTEAWEALGTANYKLQPSAESNRQFSRSLFFISDLSSGETIQREHVKSVRPGSGISPKYLEQVLGNKVIKSVKKNTPVSEEQLMYKIQKKIT